MDQSKKNTQTTDKACRLYPRKNANTRNIKTVAEEDPEGRKCYTVHIPDRPFGDIANQTQIIS